MLKRMGEYSPLEQFQMVFTGTSILLNEAYLDQQLYIMYKNSFLDKLSEDKLLEMKALELLENLGYNFDLLGTYLYKAVIVKASNHISAISKENKIAEIDNLKQELSNAYSQFYFDLARNERDIGTKTFHKYILDSHNQTDTSKADPMLVYEIYGEYPNEIVLSNDVLLLGSYLANSELEKSLNVDVPKVKQFRILNKRKEHS